MSLCLDPSCQARHEGDELVCKKKGCTVLADARERCPTCGKAVTSVFDHVDRFTCPVTGACLEVNDDEMTNEKWDEACAEGAWRKYVNGKPALEYDYDSIFSHAAALTDADIRERLKIPKWLWAFLSEETRAKLHELME